MSIYVGTSTTPIAMCCVYVGGQAAQAMYVGATKVWPDASLVPAQPTLTLVYDDPLGVTVGTIGAVTGATRYEWQEEGSTRWNATSGRVTPLGRAFHSSTVHNGAVFGARACNANGCSTVVSATLSR